jgi:broad specificity phosphatase PhoE
MIAPCSTQHAVTGSIVRTLILTRHSLPEIVPGVPASHWRLSDEGRCRCEALADRLTSYQPAVIVASVEPKAVETGQLLAAHLEAPMDTAEGLHEHDRSNVGFLSTEAFQAAVATFFVQPEDLVLGRETAAQARRRFMKAIHGLLEHYPGGNVLIVAHGTVISLFVAACAGVEPFPFWQRLGLPSYVALSVPDYTLLETVENIEQEDA